VWYDSELFRAVVSASGGIIGTAVAVILGRTLQERFRRESERLDAAQRGLGEQLAGWKNLVVSLQEEIVELRAEMQQRDAECNRRIATLEARLAQVYRRGD
jgi:hypothetical protein